MLPQFDRLRRVATLLATREEVAALWLGGSFGTGQADLYSDVDLRIAVQPEALAAWRQADLQALFEGECAGSHFIEFGPDLFLHHLALITGDLFDLLVQSIERDPFPEALVVLACRDANFAPRLERATPAAAAPSVPADPAAILQAVMDFWINTLKHRKVLHRSLDLLTLTGLEEERGMLMRLWFVTATGLDTGAGRGTIHGKTPVIRAVEGLLGPHALAILGAPARNRAEILQVIDAHRDEVSRTGRLLAERLGFSYPEALEETVRRTWQEFLAVEELPGTRET